MMRFGFVLDGSTSRVTREDFRYLKGMGVQGFIQCLQTGGFSATQAQVRAVAAANLSDALAEGLPIGGYLNTQPWRSVSVILNDAIAVAGPFWDSLRMVSNDMEIDGITEAQCLETTLAIEETGKLAPAYTAWWFASRYGGMRWPWLASRGGWDADYDGRPELDLVRWGPPDMPVVGKQYNGTIDLGGDLFDLNFFDLDQLTGKEIDDVALTARQEETLEHLAGLLGWWLGPDAGNPGAPNLITADHFRLGALLEQIRQADKSLSLKETVRAVITEELVKFPPLVMQGVTIPQEEIDRIAAAVVEKMVTNVRLGKVA